MAIARATGDFIATRLADDLDEIDAETNSDHFQKGARDLESRWKYTLEIVDKRLVVKKTFKDDIGKFETNFCASLEKLVEEIKTTFVARLTKCSKGFWYRIATGLAIRFTSLIPLHQAIGEPAIASARDLLQRLQDWTASIDEFMDKEGYDPKI